MSDLTDRRDVDVFGEVDAEGGQDVRSVAATLGMSRTHVQAAMWRLHAAGSVVHVGHHPRVWVATGTPTDARVSVTRTDAELLVHVLRWAIDAGHCMNPELEGVITRVEAEF